VTRVAAHINDAAITVLNDSRIVYREPGFALLNGDRLITGSEAFRKARIDPRRIQHRYWSNLTIDPLPDVGFSHLSAADLVVRQLEQVIQSAGSTEIVFAIPAYMTQQHLGLLLGIAAELKLTVVAMIDAAVAATRREYKAAVPVHVDISLHSASLTRLSQASGVQIERVELLQDSGSYALFDAWLNCLAEAFVQQSRFDPLHTAETEQMLVDRMSGWLDEAARSDKVRLLIEFGSTTYEAEIESLRLIGAAAPVYERMASRLRSMFRADEMPALQITDRVARLPGLADMLKARVGGELFVLEPGATARGALARCDESMAGGAGVSLIRNLPWDQSAIRMPEAEVTRSAAGMPTHLLFGNKAYAIGNSALEIGSEDTGFQRFLMLDSAMPGVSRHHCSVKRKNSQCVLEDHSRYGTFLNGHRVDGASILHIGDSVRVGSPGFEFRLITTDENDG